ncbi:CarboxypepD_reg-like domain-containing protein [Paucidesulfovibrio gracilis DSM 16080]|uniref:CarboxypepD_reg-like domain-containing protein n=1 Tax=Paucidesulfovibrio gracilis DSM 16080 TaxID=1121449 RepID=A0A1T4X848_9BACT|nr:carboxypeptidase regulatory-like domain-containing protein [Paucidesulfovibrio gracilis]SKA85597.1 CarboxypepD_reg-like domain-containing protein [Paucidesulfovibrio gracilis DSM 16080]
MVDGNKSGIAATFEVIVQVRHTLLSLMLVLALAAPTWARGPVSGLVVDSSGPLSGVRVESVETGESTVTAGDGRFRLRISRSGTVSLRFSRQGYKTLTRKIEEAATDIIVSMKPRR